MPARVRVATYNLYLGADLSLLLGDQAADELAANSAEVRRQLQATAFHRRVTAIAAQLARERLDLVGLQEVATWHADGVVVADFAAELLTALAALGESFEVVATVPTFRAAATLGPGSHSVTFELLGSNVILRNRRSAVRVTASETGLFGEALEVTAMGLTARIDRGWCTATCGLAGDDAARFSFVATHTEAYDPVSRDRQRDELLTVVGAAERRSVLVGDLNATPDEVRLPPGFVDAWVAARAAPTGGGATCCQAPDLSNPSSQLTERIDYVFVRGADVVSCHRLGADPADRAAAGLWPSDHAGVVAEVELTG